jgi:YD repeat-containing protein
MERVKYVRQSDGIFSEFTYHPTLGKVTVFSNVDGRREFKYDRAGNVVRMQDGKGHRIDLGYDGNSRINRIVETSKAEHVRRELVFGYNEHGKPTLIRMRGKGEIKVAYGSDGEISKVDSRQGTSIALEVSRAFNELLAQTHVANVSLCL